jgi:hypothetical protein
VPLADLTNQDDVIATFAAGAAANLAAACREFGIDRISAPGRLIATGDLHDNPMHFAKVVHAAGLDEGADPAKRAHLVLHEVIHSDRLIGGVDLSYRALAKVADLKSRHPEFVHTLLANHELAQYSGTNIIKDGIKPVEAFNAGVEYVFGDGAEPVLHAIKAFIRSMPIALRCSGPKGEFLVSHSLPSAAMMTRFDPTILSRELTVEDYEPRKGSVHLLVWGRGYDHELVEDLVERWGVSTFIVGHEHAENGVRLVDPCVLILNSDHEKGVYLPIDLADPPRVEEMLARVVSLAGVE